MKTKKQLMAGLGAITLLFAGAGLAASPVMGKTADTNRCGTAGDLRSLEECECEAALKENTIEALEGFLHRFGNVNGTACTAVAKVSLDRFRPDSDPDIGPPTDGSPY